MRIHTHFIALDKLLRNIQTTYMYVLAQLSKAAHYIGMLNDLHMHVQCVLYIHVHCTCRYMYIVIQEFAWITLSENKLQAIAQ